MINISRIHYIAGLLEGEGCFGYYNNCPSVQIAMTDADVIRKARSILDINCRNNIRVQKGGFKRKEKYAISVSGDVAIQWMMTLYLLMSIRRKEKIKEIISSWKSRTTKSQDMIRKEGPKNISSAFYHKNRRLGVYTA